jgi:hypothetical protein
LTVEWAESKGKLGAAGTSGRAYDYDRVLQFVRNLRQWNVIATFLKSEKKQCHAILIMEALNDQKKTMHGKSVSEGYLPIPCCDSNRILKSNNHSNGVQETYQR